MLLLVDLDNTLVNRAAAFNNWAGGFMRSRGGSASDTSWLIAADRDGYEPRELLAQAIKERCDSDLAVEAIVQTLLYDHVASMTMDPSTPAALRHARESGWRIGVVTNGTAEQQTLKIRTVGLETYVDAVIISETEGVKKPNAEIFHMAASRLGADMAGGWMIGDNPTADIVGGRMAGLKTGWVSRGQRWPSGIAGPDIAAVTAAEVIDAVVHSAPRH